MQVHTLYICVATFPAQHFPKLRFYEFFVATRYPHQISAKYCLLKLMNQPSPVSKIDNRKKTSSSSIWPNVEPSRHTTGWNNFCRRILFLLQGVLASRSTLNILVIFYWNFLLGGSHLWPLSVNMSTSIIWCDSNKKVQYFSVWLWYTLCSPLMAYHHNDRLCEKVSWLLPNHIPIKLLFLFSTQLN